jgi:D-glycero-D-manno-heptose 1,7-bisphosphate phosphatase
MKPLILLDRDGVLNSIVIDAEHGTIDSPLHPSQVNVYPWVPQALQLLNSKNYGLAIVTNQPAFAKGKTTRENLEGVHQKVVQIAESGGGKILSSHICFHRSEDGCHCRKPKTGLLEEAFSRNSEFSRQDSWMVGDGVHDVRAGHSLALQTVFIGPRKWDAERVFEDCGFRPTLWVENLMEFAEAVPRVGKF